MIIEFEELFSINNNNYYSVSVHNVSLKLNRNSRDLLPKLNYTRDSPIAARSVETLSVKVTYVLYEQNDPLIQLCIDSIISELFTFVSSYVSFATLWNKDELYFVDNVQYIACTNSSIWSGLN
jgi:hypothetical protein